MSYFTLKSFTILYFSCTSLIVLFFTLPLSPLHLFSQFSLFLLSVLSPLLSLISPSPLPSLPPCYTSQRIQRKINDRAVDAEIFVYSRHFVCTVHSRDVCTVCTCTYVRCFGCVYCMLILHCSRHAYMVHIHLYVYIN